MANHVSLKNVSIALAALGIGIGMAQAQAASVTGTASAVVLTPLTITKNADMNFGTVGGDNNVATKVILGISGGVTADPLNPGAYVANDGAAGSYTVTGVAGQTYILTLNNGADISLTGPVGSTAMTIAHASLANNSTGTLTAGTDTFALGGTLSINAGQMAGTYTGNYTVTVAY